MVKTDVERAIAFIEDCLESHVADVEWLKGHPEFILEMGDVPFHEEQARQYNHVLAILREVAQSLE